MAALLHHSALLGKGMCGRGGRLGHGEDEKVYAHMAQREADESKRRDGQGRREARLVKLRLWLWIC